MKIQLSIAITAALLSGGAAAAGTAVVQRPAAAPKTVVSQLRAACPAGYDYATIQAMRPEESGYGVILTLRGPKVNREEGALHSEAQRQGLRVGGAYCARSSEDDLVDETEAQALQRAQQQVRGLR